MADLALELGGKPAHRRVAFLFGLLVGLCTLSVGAAFGGLRNVGLGCLPRGRLEQARELMSDPDQHASFHDENARV